MTAHKPPHRRTQQWEPLNASASSDDLTLQVCEQCSTTQYPPREICRHCLSDELVWQAVSAQGAVLAVSPLHLSLDAWFREQVPWSIASVKLDVGPVVICHANQGDLTSGDRVMISNDLDPSGSSSLNARKVERSIE